MALFFEVKCQSELQDDTDSQYDERRGVVFNPKWIDDFFDRFDYEVDAHQNDNRSNDDGSDALNFFALGRFVYREPFADDNNKPRNGVDKTVCGVGNNG